MEVQVYVDEPVTRTLGGIVEYAYKIIGTIDPPADELLWLHVGDAVDPLFEQYTMRMTTKGTRTGEGTGPWGTCSICRYDYPVSAMVFKSGKYYCNDQKCSDDLL